MKILDIYINGFGKFHGRNLSFEDGLNIVYGKNEAGKSTIHTFIRGMLFGIENSADGPPETICTPSLSPGKTAALRGAAEAGAQGPHLPHRTDISEE